jgi:hypothetical protein
MSQKYFRSSPQFPFHIDCPVYSTSQFLLPLPWSGPRRKPRWAMCFSFNRLVIFYVISWKIIDCQCFRFAFILHLPFVLILKPFTEFSTEKSTKIKRLCCYAECQMAQFKCQYLLVWIVVKFWLCAVLWSRKYFFRLRLNGAANPNCDSGPGSG